MVQSEDMLFLRFVLLWARIESPHNVFVLLFKEVIPLQLDILVCLGHCSNIPVYKRNIYTHSYVFVGLIIIPTGRWEGPGTRLLGPLMSAQMMPSHFSCETGVLTLLQSVESGMEMDFASW